MNHGLKAAVAVVWVFSGMPALAAESSALSYKSDDGHFDAKLSGRIHFDANIYLNDDDISTPTKQAKDEYFFRSARLTLDGRAYDYSYRIEHEFAASPPGLSENTEGLREVWIGHQLMGSTTLRLGQAKPYRSLDGIASANDLVFMEPAFASPGGIFSKAYVLGAFLDGAGDGYGWGVSAYSPRAVADVGSSGKALNARGFVVPIRSDSQVLHLGLSASSESYDEQPISVRPRIIGREGGLRVTKTGANQIITGGTYNKQTTIAAEFATRIGAMAWQSEYARASFKDSLSATPAARQAVETYYVQASYMLTDHIRLYDAKKGVFKAPKVQGTAGAVELKARYDRIENKDLANREGAYYTLGVNYYPRSNVRFMLEYADGQLNNASPTELEASAITARAQLVF